MGYLHIDNLYKNKSILFFKECYSLLKIHGTSAHIQYIDYFREENKLTFFSGGEKHERFLQLFNQEELLDRFKSLCLPKVIVYGEAFGGKQQGMSHTYGPNLQFAAFDVSVEDNWLDVPNAEDVVKKLNLEFVPYTKISTNLEDIEKEKLKPDNYAIKNGISYYENGELKNPKVREGVVLRPLIEVKTNNGKRIIAKHKNDQFAETASPRVVSDEELKVLEDAKSIAEEWVTLMRLEHVLQKLPQDIDLSYTPKVIRAMYEDIIREAKDEIVISKSVEKAISNKAKELFYKKIKTLTRLFTMEQ
jgi:hypothetical protein